MEECDIARQLAAKSLNQQCKAAPVPLQLQRFSVECGAMEPLPDASHTLAKQPTSFVIPGLAKREPGIHTPDRGYGFRTAACRDFRNDERP